MDIPSKQSKAADTTSPSKRRGRFKGNRSPRKADSAQTAKDDVSTKTTTRHDQAANTSKVSGDPAKHCRSISSPKKKSPQKQRSPAEVPQETTNTSMKKYGHHRAYSSPRKPSSEDYRRITLCRYWTSGKCSLGETCRYLHEQSSGGAAVKAETIAESRDKEQKVATTAPLSILDPRRSFKCGKDCHPMAECLTLMVSAENSTLQLNGEVSRILATDSNVKAEDGEAFFTSLEETNSQAFTDRQIHGKLSETTTQQLLQHAFAVREAAQDAMKLAYRSGQASDYEKANSLDELAKEILATPGLSLGKNTMDYIVAVATKYSG